MYKCNECGQVFEVPKKYCTEEEIFDGCPNIQCQGTYEKVFKCSLCDDWKLHDVIHKGICYECAENEYSHRLGLKYIELNKDFYLDFYGVEKVDKDLKGNLVGILEREFMSNVDLASDWNSYLARVKEYCLDDMYDWVEFLKEEI